MLQSLQAIHLQQKALKLTEPPITSLRLKLQAKNDFKLL
jgi:hypothetical protein